MLNKKENAMAINPTKKKTEVTPSDLATVYKILGQTNELIIRLSKVVSEQNEFIHQMGLDIIQLKKKLGVK